MRKKGKPGERRRHTVEAHGDGWLVLEVLADAWQVGDDGDPERLQQSLGADAGQLEDLRCVQGPSGEDDFFRGVDGAETAAGRREILDAHGLRALEQHFGDRVLSQKVVVRPRRDNPLVVVNAGIAPGPAGRVFGRREPENALGRPVVGICGGRDARVQGGRPEVPWRTRW